MPANALRNDIACPAPCATASMLREWHLLPDLIDGIASPDEQLVLESARQLEELSRRHADWLGPFRATLLCVAGIRRQGPAARYLLAATVRLPLSVL